MPFSSLEDAGETDETDEADEADAVATCCPSPGTSRGRRRSASFRGDDRFPRAAFNSSSRGTGTARRKSTDVVSLLSRAAPSFGVGPEALGSPDDAFPGRSRSGSLNEIAETVEEDEVEPVPRASLTTRALHALELGASRKLDMLQYALFKPSPHNAETARRRRSMSPLGRTVISSGSLRASREVFRQSSSASSIGSIDSCNAIDNDDDNDGGDGNSSNPSCCLVAAVMSQGAPPVPFKEHDSSRCSAGSGDARDKVLSRGALLAFVEPVDACGMLGVQPRLPASAVASTHGTPRRVPGFDVTAQ